MEKRLGGQVVWVTGAGTGIGRAAAVALVREGAGRLALLGRREGLLQETAALVQAEGGQAKVVVLDVQERVRVDAAGEGLLAEWGRVDVLVNNAGLNVPERKLHALSPASWDLVLGVNLSGAYNMIRAVLPAMRKQEGGLIINVSSMAGKRASGLSGAAYTASKHGLNGLSHAINAEEWKHGIRACALCPGEVNTEIIDKRPVPLSAEIRQRMMQAEDLGQAVAFVACMHPRTVVTEMLLLPTHQRAFLPGETG